MWINIENKLLKQEPGNNVFLRVSGKLRPRKTAPWLGLEPGLGLELGLGTIFLGGNCPRTILKVLIQWNVFKLRGV